MKYITGVDIKVGDFLAYFTRDSQPGRVIGKTGRVMKMTERLRHTLGETSQTILVRLEKEPGKTYSKYVTLRNPIAVWVQNPRPGMHE